MQGETFATRESVRAHAPAAIAADAAPAPGVSGGGSPRPRPRLCVVGPLVGHNPGRVTTQGEILARLFAESGYDVRAVSRAPGRWARLREIALSLVRWRAAVDVLLIQSYGGPSFVVEDIASAIGRRTGRAVVLHLRGGDMPRFFARYPRWTRRVLARADAIVAPTDYLARAVRPYARRDARIIPNVIDVDAYPFAPRERVAPRLLWMRAFHPLYNPAMALRVLARVREARADATLVMAGQDDGMLRDVRALAERMGLARAVRFPGFLDHAAKLREAARADIFIGTNRVDNTPVSVIEAGALGLPVVATDVGGVRWLVRDGESALLVPDDDDAAMAAAVLRLTSEPALSHRLSLGGRALAERSAWREVRAEWERLFDELPEGAR